MLSDRNKKRLNILVWVFVGIAIVMMIISGVMDYMWDKEHEQWELDNQIILEDALASENIHRCKEYKDEVKCEILVAKSGGIDLCDELEAENSIEILVCKAGVLEDLNICDGENLTKTWQGTCKSIVDHALGRIYGG